MTEKMLGCEDVVFNCPLQPVQLLRDCKECKFFGGSQLHFYTNENFEPKGETKSFHRIDCKLEDEIRLVKDFLKGE